MAAKHDAVINELNIKIDKFIKLYMNPHQNDWKLLQNGKISPMSQRETKMLSFKIEVEGSFDATANKP
ncbi:MAG: hypothetical protein K2L23_00780, partial [Odoribacter sp.]|nr:hypothetical protein [Odoribacter sp.]